MPMWPDCNLVSIKKYLSILVKSAPAIRECQIARNFPIASLPEGVKYSSRKRAAQKSLWVFLEKHDEKPDFIL